MTAKHWNHRPGMRSRKNGSWPRFATSFTKSKPTPQPKGITPTTTPNGSQRPTAFPSAAVLDSSHAISPFSTCRLRAPERCGGCELWGKLGQQHEQQRRSKRTNYVYQASE